MSTTTQMTISVPVCMIDPSAPVKAVVKAIEDILEVRAEAVVGNRNITFYPADLRNSPVSVAIPGKLRRRLRRITRKCINGITFSLCIPTALLWGGSSLVEVGA